MARLRIAQTTAVAELAQFLYYFLPATPHPFSDPAISFPGVASKLGIANLWPGRGNKLSQITTLLQSTLESRPEKFCDLIEDTIAMSMRYTKKGPPFREEIELLNELVAPCGFKVPALCDPQYLRSLPRQQPAPAVFDATMLTKLNEELIALTASEEVKERGFKFEAFLNQLFTASGL